MKKGEYGLLLILFFFMLCKNSSAEEKDTVWVKEKSAKYFVVGAGSGQASIRDYGTSPLVYSGIFPLLNLGYEQSSRKVVFQINLCSSLGNYNRKIFEKPFEIKAYEFEFKTSYLRAIHIKENKHQIWLMGGGIIHQTSIRIAEQFLNSGFVVDNISHLCAEFGFRKFLHQSARARKIGRITFKRPDRNFLFQSLIRLPVVSSFYRPGYVFIANGTKEDYKVFEQYHLNFLSFRGLFFSNSFSRLMRNGNSIRLSYDWSVVTSGNKLPNRLELARHYLQLSLFFRIN